ncbi:choice-of-anchor M domain-containing protein [Fontisphaera persica]|uniref:choice-of-anchor M domain-containing protein n=1 Tax=Fontisphaera persica TaxID=2974023 RepID=UPI0024C0631D|nr:choice-of-anchor M domain-containing protein [Fontisphaera persica]WCJ59804.1 choice-of-anchor M domain-containing protein [Fontisphaera persica]
MKKLLFSFLLTAGLGMGFAAPSLCSACFHLTSEHADLRVTFTQGATPPLGLIIYCEALETGFATNEITIVAPEHSRLTLPPGTPFGEAGASLWVLPQTAQPNLPLLGSSGEGVPEGVLVDNRMEIRLTRVEGPGHFLLWQTLGPGQFNLLMDSRDGLSANDQTTLEVNAHKHHAWGFTTTGVYRLTFQAAGTLVGQSQPTLSPGHTFIFHVLPLRPWENWQATHWPCECNPQLIGPGADPDADGVVNVAEYAQGSNPHLPDAHERPQATVVRHNGTPYGALIFFRAKAATDVLAMPLAATQLLGSSWENTMVIQHVEDLGDRERITIRDALPLTQAVQRWYQWRLQLSP